MKTVTAIRQKETFFKNADEFELDFSIEIKFSQKIKDILSSDVMKKSWKNTMLYHKARLTSLIQNPDSVMNLK